MTDKSRYQPSLTVGSLFSGIGGMELGLERAGFRVLWQCEIDDYARRVLEKHWPGVPKYGDIRTLSGASLPVPDLLCGGFPCQDISEAGKRAGITGERSGLWSEFARLIGELRPRYVLVENVSALLRRGIDRVLGDLSEIGYDAEWEVLPAAAFGAPHIRERVFILAYSHGMGTEREYRQLDGPAGTREEQASERERVWDAAGHGGEDVADSSGTRCAAGIRREGGTIRNGARRSQPERRSATLADTKRECSQGWWSIEPDVGRVADGVPARVDRLRGLGNAVVPQVAEWIGRQIITYETARQEAAS